MGRTKAERHARKNPAGRITVNSTPPSGILTSGISLGSPVTPQGSPSSGPSKEKLQAVVDDVDVKLQEVNLASGSGISEDSLGRAGTSAAESCDEAGSCSKMAMDKKDDCMEVSDAVGINEEEVTTGNAAGAMDIMLDQVAAVSDSLPTVRSMQVQPFIQLERAMDGVESISDVSFNNAFDETLKTFIQHTLETKMRLELRLMPLDRKNHELNTAVANYLLFAMKIHIQELESHRRTVSGPMLRVRFHKLAHQWDGIKKFLAMSRIATQRVIDGELSTAEAAELIAHSLV